MPMAGATRPACCISRAIRLRPCRSPLACRSAWTRGARIRLTRGRMHGPNPFRPGLVGNGVSRGRPVGPRMVARLAHAEHARRGGDGEAGLVRAHEPEELDGTAPVSRANPAAAFERMARSSRRSRANSRSDAARPGIASSRLPSCLSAAATHAPIDCAVGSNPRDRSSRETVQRGVHQTASVPPRAGAPRSRPSGTRRRVARPDWTRVHRNQVERLWARLKGRAAERLTVPSPRDTRQQPAPSWACSASPPHAIGSSANGA